MTRAVLFGIPTIDGDINVELAGALFNASQTLLTKGIPSGFAFQKGCSLVQKARSDIMNGALRIPGVTDLFFIDADMWMSADDIVKMIEAADDKHVLTAMYATQGNPPEIRCDSPGSEFEIRPDGCIEVERIGTGAMIIRRHVMEAVAEKYNHLRYQAADGKMEPAIFDVPLTEDGYKGEDFNFCDDVRDLGFRIYALADVTTYHIKKQELVFNMAQYMQDDTVHPQ